MKNLLLFAIAAASLAGPAANADTVVISGSGTWGASAPVTPESAPGDTFSFSFDLPSPYTWIAYAGGELTSEVTDLSYDLDGAPVGISAVAAAFYPASTFGGFDLFFSDGNWLSAYGGAIGSSGAITTGTYAVDFDIDYTVGAPPGVGSGIVDASVVPEPTSAALMLTGLLGLAAVRCRVRPAGSRERRIFEAA